MSHPARRKVQRPAASAFSADVSSQEAIDHIASVVRILPAPGPEVANPHTTNHAVAMGDGPHPAKASDAFPILKYCQWEPLMAPTQLPYFNSPQWEGTATAPTVTTLLL